MATTRRQGRARLDARFGQLGAEEISIPHRGWIRAIRDALAMSSRELGERMGLSQQAAADLERSEQLGAIKLDSLRRAADALDCDLVYYLRPRSSLEEAVQEQARHKASEYLASVAHHNRLEDQGVEYEATARLLDDLTARIAERRGLWTDEPVP